MKEREVDNLFADTLVANDRRRMSRAEIPSIGD
jgi:hypothetical protein